MRIRHAERMPFSKTAKRSRDAEDNNKGVRFHTEGHVLVVTLVGDFSEKDVLNAHREASKRQGRERIQGILVDARYSRSRMSSGARYELVSSFQQIFSPTTKHAVVYSPDNYDPSEVTFVENVTFNRGIRLKMFTNIDDARDWLRDIDGSS